MELSSIQPLSFFQAIGDSIQSATCQNVGVATYLSQTIPAAGVLAGALATGATAGAAAPGAAAGVFATAAVGAAIQGILATCPAELPEQPNAPAFMGGQCDGFCYGVVFEPADGSPGGSFVRCRGPIEGIRVTADGGVFAVELRCRGTYGQNTFCGTLQPLGWYGVGAFGQNWAVGARIVSLETAGQNAGQPDDCGDPPPLPAPRPAPITISPTYNYGDQTITNDFSFRPSLNPNTTINLDGSLSADFEIDLSIDGSFSPSVEVTVTFNPDGTTRTTPRRPVREDEILPPETIEPGNDPIMPDLTEAYEIGGISFVIELPPWSGRIAQTEPPLVPQVVANFRWFFDQGPGEAIALRQASGTLGAPKTRLGPVVGYLFEPVVPYTGTVEIIAVPRE